MFEARYLKIPQEPEGGGAPLWRVEKGNRTGSLSTSASSDSESSTNAEGSSKEEKEEVAVQLASLEEKVGPTLRRRGKYVCGLSSLCLLCPVVFPAASSQRPAEETQQRAADETEEERQIKEGKKIQREVDRSAQICKRQ